jgi:hypothetical protein
VLAGDTVGQAGVEEVFKIFSKYDVDGLQNFARSLKFKISYSKSAGTIFVGVNNGGRWRAKGAVN